MTEQRNNQFIKIKQKFEKKKELPKKKKEPKKEEFLPDQDQNGHYEYGDLDNSNIWGFKMPSGINEYFGVKEGGTNGMEFDESDFNFKDDKSKP